ncbi:MAG TPA: hypothetical protein VL977_02640 [Solirubrobacteraceae bacterium]|nr:hypothetical protein [Solirubrobacteraceae bacterium]
MRRSRTPLAAVLVLALAAIAALGGTALGSTGRHAPRAHAASKRLVGIGDENPLMFSSPEWQALHVSIARYFTAWNVATGDDPTDLFYLRSWLAAAQAAGVQPLVSFYHNDTTPEQMPSVAAYTQAMQDFVAMFPTVKILSPWNEVNRGNVREPGDSYDSPTPKEAAEYYLALKRVCPTCTIVGLDVLDSTTPSATIAYINAFKHDVGKKHMPHIWGLHNYSETNRFEDNGTKAMLRDVPGQLWLTETGGLAKLKPSFPFNLKRQARATKYMFALADSSSRIKRLYIYSWFPGGSSEFDAGLVNAAGEPRASFCAVYEHIRGKKHCPYKTVKNRPRHGRSHRGHAHR